MKWTAVGIDAIISELDDCASFRHRRGFRDVVDAESADFPLAYNVLTHSNANQLVRLLRAIYRPHNVICVHVDAKVFSCSHTHTHTHTHTFNGPFSRTTRVGRYQKSKTKLVFF